MSTQEERLKKDTLDYWTRLWCKRAWCRVDYNPVRETLKWEIQQSIRSDLKKTLKSHLGKRRTDSNSESQKYLALSQRVQENVYFLAGIPLQYWSFGEYNWKWIGREGRGLKLSSITSPANFEWQTKDHIQNYQLVGDLPTFSKWKKENKKGRWTNRHPRSHKNTAISKDSEWKLHNEYVTFLKEREQEMIDDKFCST